VEELGSGVRKMYKYCPIYVKDALPIIEEGDVFKLTIRHEPLNDTINEPINGPVNAVQVVDKYGNIVSIEDEGIDGGLINGLINGPINGPINDTESSILNLIKERQGINREEISIAIGKGITTVRRYIASLKNRNLIEYRGSRKTGGYYLTTKDNPE